MQLTDFKVGQTCYCLCANNKARTTKKEHHIQKWTVTAIGRKYVTLKPESSPSRFETTIQFDSTDEFRQKHSYGSPDYTLFLTEVDLYNYLQKRDDLLFIYKNITPFADHMSPEDCHTVRKLLEKYVPKPDETKG